MDQTVQSFKCPSCGSPLKWGTESGKFECAACGSSYSLEEVKNAVRETEKEFEWGDYKKNLREDPIPATASYVCKSCGAELIVEGTTAATHCPYCDNVVVLEPNLTGSIRPNAVIPFKIDQKRLAEIVRGYGKGKLLLPKRFISENKIREVQGLYVPFWLFSTGVDGSCSFEATRSRAWSDSEYDYVETSHFLISCEGDMRFEKIPVDGSSRMDDALMDSIEPFDYSDLVDFDERYLSGFLADRFDVSADQSLPRASSRVKNSAEDVFRSAVTGYETVTPISSDLSLQDPSVRYVLLPVYLVTSKYGGKPFTFAVNGQTGKITGRLPISWGRFWGFFALFGGISAVVFTLLMLLFGA